MTKEELDALLWQIADIAQDSKEWVLSDQDYRTLTNNDPTDPDPIMQPTWQGPGGMIRIFSRYQFIFSKAVERKVKELLTKKESNNEN